jgi:hypothetical protein
MESAMRAGFLGFMLCFLATPGFVLADSTDPPSAPATAKSSTLTPELRQLAQEKAQEKLPPPESIPQPKEPGKTIDTQTKPTDMATAPTSTTSACTTQGPDLTDNHIGPCEHVWFHAGYLLWWVKNGPLPVPLLTTGSPLMISPDGVLTGGGALDQPETKILFGNTRLDYGRMSGVQAGGGAWLDNRHIWGVETDGFILERRTLHFQFASDANGNPLLARPVTDLINGDLAQDALVISSPGVASGSFDVTTTSRLWGAEANVLRNLYASDRFRADLVVGFRYLDLQENLDLLQQSIQLPGSFAPFTLPDATGTPQFLADGSTLTIAESFHTRNQVYAGQLGMRFEGHSGNAYVDVTTKVGFGPNHETVSIAGTTTAVQPGMAPQTVTGGLLALPGTNIGKTTNNWFAVVPQVNLKVGYWMRDWLQLFVGYDFLYINQVARPGDVVNNNINSALVPTSPNFGAGVGPNQPGTLFRKDDFWAQGLHFGVEFRY